MFRLFTVLLVFCLPFTAFTQVQVTQRVQVDFTSHHSAKESVQWKKTAGYFVTEAIPVPLDIRSPFFTLSAILSLSAEPAQCASGAVQWATSADGMNWSEWNEWKTDDDFDPGAEAVKCELQFLEPATRFVRIRLRSFMNPAARLGKPQAMSLAFYCPGEVSTSPQHLVEDGYDPSRACPCPQPTYVNRTGWGCPDGQSPSCSPVTYTTVTHLIVHHSAGSNTSSNWASVVNAIWSDHVNVNGWCDIGYNWLIDPNGVLYEGRGGGNNVVGAHFCGTNGNTMGTCMMGNYMAVNPAVPAVDKLEALLAWKACDANIDPLGTSVHASSGLSLAHISGHRNGCSTSCPGDLLYAALPSIRTAVSDLINNGCTATAPANDNPCTATSLQAGSACNFATFSNSNATSSAVPVLTDSLCDGPSYGDIWFSLTVPPSGRLEIDTQPGTIDDVGMALYTGPNCNNLSFHSCYRNGSTSGPWMPVAHLTGLTPGATVWLRLWEFNNNDFGTFGICAWDPCPSLPQVPNATASPQQICAGDSVMLSLTGGSAGTGGAMMWYVGGCGNGAPIGSGSSLATTVNETTAFFVRAEGNCGMSTCAEAMVTVIPPPVAAFSWLPSGGTEISFTDLSTGALTWNWDFGDGNSSTQPDPVHEFGQQGSFIVTLIVTNDCGSDTLQEELSIQLLALDAIAGEGLLVFPNPSAGDFQVQWPAEWTVHSLRLTDLSGRLLFEQRSGLQPQGTQLRLNGAAGVYLLELNTGESRHRLRLVIE